jgi:hypothetical protein
MMIRERPTIAELQDILNAEGESRVEVLPNGEVLVHEELTRAREEAEDAKVRLACEQQETKRLRGELDQARTELLEEIVGILREHANTHDIGRGPDDESAEAAALRMAIDAIQARFGGTEGGGR